MKTVKLVINGDVLTFDKQREFYSFNWNNFKDGCNVYFESEDSNCQQVFIFLKQDEKNVYLGLTF